MKKAIATALIAATLATGCASLNEPDRSRSVNRTNVPAQCVGACEDTD